MTNIGYYVLFDVGGTNVKADLYSNDTGFVQSRPSMYPAHSQASREAILENFTMILEQFAQQVPSNHELAGLGFAFPGPFDYHNGVSLIHGLAKYEALYQVDLKQYFQRYLVNHGYPEAQLLFMNDAQAFGLGEFDQHQVERGLYITLGTGCGSCFVDAEGIAYPRIAGVNDAGMIYDAPFEDGVIDEYLSARGLQRLIAQSGQPADSGLKLFEQAEHDDVGAQAVFRSFGQTIERALLPFVAAFRPNELVFGGEISQSLKYIRPGFNQLPTLTHIAATQNTSISTMLGLVSGLKSAQ